MRLWAEKGVRTIKDIVHDSGRGWKTFQEQPRLRNTRSAPNLYANLISSIPWEANPMPPHKTGQWLAQKEELGDIQYVYHLQRTTQQEGTLYRKEKSETLTLLGHNQRIPAGSKEVRIIRTLGPKNGVLDFNPTEETEPEQTLWIWGNDWIMNLEWDPKE